MYVSLSIYVPHDEQKCLPPYYSLALLWRPSRLAALAALQIVDLVMSLADEGNYELEHMAASYSHAQANEQEYCVLKRRRFECLKMYGWGATTTGAATAARHLCGQLMLRDDLYAIDMH